MCMTRDFSLNIPVNAVKFACDCPVMNVRQDFRIIETHGSPGNFARVRRQRIMGVFSFNTCMSVRVILGRKCTLAASRAASW